jgi:periplasmic protein TonB
MSHQDKYYSSFEDLVFENRNKEYGAYVLRKKYIRTLTISTVTGIVILVLSVCIPYYYSKRQTRQNTRVVREVIAEMSTELLDQEVPPPPVIPPEPPQEIESVTKYVAPVVVDSVLSDEINQLAITDEQVNTAPENNTEWVQAENRVDTLEEVPTVVEEMPHFPGGEMALVRYILNSIRYPVVAEKNGIHGKVYVTFIVGINGEIMDARVAQSVDPLLDREALRVVRSLPRWIPGKQPGKPVRVAYTVPINFVLK